MRPVDQLDLRRQWVPTPRQRAGGSRSGYEFGDLPAEEPSARVAPGAVVTGIRELLDIRSITAGGPILPLVMIAYSGFFTALDLAAVQLFFPDIKDDFHASLAVLAASNTALSLVISLLAPFMGFVADRVRRVTVLAVSTVVGQAAVALRGTAPGLGQFVGWNIFGGLAGSFGQPIGFPLLTDYYPPHTRARVIAFWGMTSTLGAILAPVLAGFVGSYLGWRGTFVAVGVVGAILSLGYFLLKEPIRGRLDRKAMGADEATAMREQKPVGWSEGWRIAASIRTLRRLWIVQLLVTVVGVSGPTFLSLLYVQKFHLGVLDRGFLISAATAPAIVGLALSGMFADRILSYKPGRLMPMLASLAMLSAAGLVVLAVAPFLWMVVLMNAVQSFFTYLTQPALLTLVSLVVPARIRGLGLMTVHPFTLVGLVANIFVAGFADANGIEAALIVLVVIQVVDAIVIATAGDGVAQDMRAALAASMADVEASRSRAEGRTKMLICRDVDVTYEGAQVLFNVDFDVVEGDFVALLGTNGAGKSTLLRAIAGLHQASNGAIFFDGDDITHLPPEQVTARGVVMMPGGRAVFPTLTVEQNLKTAAWMYRGDRAYVRTKTEEVLNRFPRLRERLHTQAGNLSGGEQQMVALSQALLMRPRLLMIDELSLGLAPQVVEVLLDALRQINEQGTTVIIVEQSINVALQVARRAVFMEKGEVRFDGPVSELIARPDVVRSVFLSHASGASSLGRRAGPVEPEGDVETVLDVQDVGLSYGGIRVLSGVTIRAARGEIVGVVGPNGAGKTSLFDVISGFARPDRGKVRLLGADVTDISPDARARAGLARSYQNVRLFPALTVRENIAVALERHLASRSLVLAAVWSPATRRAERRVERRVDNLVELLGLGAYANKFVNELSTGTRRIVDIACLLAAQPSLLLLDEPSSGLAQAETEQLGPVIQRLVKEAGCGVLLIEHDLGLVAAVSDRLVALRLGEVMAEGRPAEVLADQQVVDALLGGASSAVLSRSVQLTGAAGS